MPLSMISISTASCKLEDKQGECVTPDTDQGERERALVTLLAAGGVGDL